MLGVAVFIVLVFRVFILEKILFTIVRFEVMNTKDRGFFTELSFGKRFWRLREDNDQV